jgi:hypothetical protein
MVARHTGLYHTGAGVARKSRRESASRYFCAVRRIDFCAVTRKKFSSDASSGAWRPVDFARVFADGSDFNGAGNAEHFARSANRRRGGAAPLKRAKVTRAACY